jgi:hypothetical protein
VPSANKDLQVSTTTDKADDEDEDQSDVFANSKVTFLS